MKKISVIVIFFITTLLPSCSHFNMNNSSDQNRTPSSELDRQCQTSLISIHSEQEHSLCHWAQDYLRQISQTSINLHMSHSYQSNASKRKIITLSAQLSKNEIEQILGRGGLRIRYLRYMLNELSHHQSLAKSDETTKKDVMQNFPLVELILEPQD